MKRFVVEKKEMRNWIKLFLQFWQGHPWFWWSWRIYSFDMIFRIFVCYHTHYTEHILCFIVSLPSTRLMSCCDKEKCCIFVGFSAIWAVSGTQEAILVQQPSEHRKKRKEKSCPLQTAWHSYHTFNFSMVHIVKSLCKHTLLMVWTDRERTPKRKKKLLWKKMYLRLPEPIMSASPTDFMVVKFRSLIVTV